MIIAVGSLKASPGATTLALALADRWPADAGDPLLVEADPAGGDLGARFGLLAGGRGLVTLAAAGRRGGGQRSAEEHAHQLPGGLAVIPAPAGAEQASHVLGELDGGGWSLLWSAARAGGRTVIVDCGRLDPRSPAGPALRAADVLLLVARARDDELAHLAARMHVVQGWGVPAWYVVVVAQPYRSPDYRVREIARVLGSRVLGPVPYDTTAAEVLVGRRQTRTGISRSKLGRTVAAMADHLAATVPVAAATPALGAGSAGFDDRAALPPTRTVRR
ncbi:hypothetical protein E0F15_18435 [Frankia sp. B2]|uniref:MinD/ParA family ATP-binding protein n=1 Tax=Frankia sp. B2 TaxID=2541730 RepID=UPI00106C3C5D|nr:hypothetical protein [Frankia sp. B2]TFE26232.1 hypothetical protein E0F15_18435 [Frankia sp. B2]